MLQIGEFSPDFCLPVTSGEDSTFNDLVGKKGMVLFFYPKDLTPGCTQEVADFQGLLSEFKKEGFSIVGVSKDSVQKHQKFSEKMQLNFPLIADVDGELCEFFGSWKEKKLYGKVYMGIERSTFVLDDKGEILWVQEKVRVKGHAEKVLEIVQNL